MQADNQSGATSTESLPLGTLDLISPIINSATPEIVLETLLRGCPGLSPELGAYLAQACAVCLDHNNHESSITLDLMKSTHESLVKWFDKHGEGEYSLECYEGQYQLTWDKSKVSEQVRDANADLQETTEFGACAIAILLVLNLTTFTVRKRANKSTGVDYWLCLPDGPEPFIEAARLEVSGILRGDLTELKSRAKQKIGQTSQSDKRKLPAYIIVSEFSNPMAFMGVKRPME